MDLYQTELDSLKFLNEDHDTTPTPVMDILNNAVTFINTQVTGCPVVLEEKETGVYVAIWLRSANDPVLMFEVDIDRLRKGYRGVVSHAADVANYIPSKYNFHSVLLYTLINSIKTK